METNVDIMKEYFEKRTNLHIGLVRKYLIKIYDWDNNIFTPEILAEELSHDALKWEEPEYTPYVHLTWKYKLANEGGKYELPKDIELKAYEATFHHIKHHKHHPEFWMKDITIEYLNKVDRNAPPDIVDATEMPLPYIASMMADWCAMSEEKKSNLQEWIDKNVNVRWKFSEEQVNLIQNIANAIGKNE